MLLFFVHLRSQQQREEKSSPISNLQCIRSVKKMSDEVQSWLSVWREVQMIFVWSNWYHVISCIIKMHIGLTFFVLAYPGCPGKESIKQMYFVI